MTITEFLLARITEDEEVATGGAPSPWREGGWDGKHDGPREVLDRHGEVTTVAYYGGTYGHVLRFDPTRLLAECRAKRRLVESHSACDDVSYGDAATCLVMRTLATVYADHPDFREEWQ